MFLFKRLLYLLMPLGFIAKTYADSPVLDPNILAEKLGWVNTIQSTNNTARSDCYLCGGYYNLEQFPIDTPVNIRSAPVKIEAGPPVHYKLNGNVEFENGVTITQPGRSLFADHAVITPNVQTGKLDAISAQGNIRLAEPGELILAKSLQADLINHQAKAVDIIYLMRVGELSPTLLASQPSDLNFTGFGHGTASVVYETAENQFTLKEATYSTCSPLTRTWELEASSINVNQNEGEGRAYNTILKVHGLPLFYLPYFSFPTSNQRKSGFLYGNVNSNSTNGFSLSLPYYFNLAPNYDYTLTPTLFTKRGVMFDNNFRYLTHSSTGSVDLQVLPDDQNYNHKWRYSYMLDDTTNLTSNWNTNINYNAVSDDNYLESFNVYGANQVLLNRSASVNYQDLHWNFSGLLQAYQIVNPTLTTTNQPYSQLPALSLSGSYPGLLEGLFNFSLNSNLINFSKNAGYMQTDPINGLRLNLAPEISMPLTKSYGYITPSVSFYSTYYMLSNADVNGYADTSPAINVPIINVDSSLYFDRAFTWNKQSYSQTLSPRLFYLYVPYRNQNTIPVFDTSIVPFNYSQLFTTNSFSGYDRIQNANQLSYAMSTTINNAAGAQLISAGAGQIWYFVNRKVTICQTQPGQANCIETENPAANLAFSDIAGYFTYNFNPTWQFQVDATYNPSDSWLDTQNYTLSYTPNNMDVFNISYQSNRQNYGLLSIAQTLAGAAPPASSILNTSFVWGLTPKWALFGNLNYSFEDNGPIAQFGGIQYSSCCWAVRLGDYRSVVNNNPNTPNVLTGQMTNTFMIQFLLKGLGGVSSGALSSLVSTIPTYHGQLGF